jgi:hypothetical protein
MIKSQQARVRCVGCFIVLSYAISGVCQEMSYSKLWRDHHDAPEAYLGKDLKMKQESNQGATADENRFVITGTRPGAKDGLNPATTKNLSPVAFQIGNKSGKPVFVEVFTEASHADAVARELGGDPSRLAALSEQVKKDVSLADHSRPN